MRKKIRFAQIVSGLAAVAAFCVASAAQAAATSLPAFKVVAATTAIDPNTADSYYLAHNSDLAGSVDLWSNGYPPEITALAQSLHNNVDLIYEYVRNNIETAPMYGLQKGALGALIDQSGTDFDQAQLMVDLLRAAKYTAGYQAGTITISGDQARSWFGGVTDVTSLKSILADGGIPATISPTVAPPATATVTSVVLSTVWVQVTINGTTYLFDPSFKPHTYTSGINLGTAMGYSDAGFTGTAATGMTTCVAYATSGCTPAYDSTHTVSVPYISNVNNAGIQSTLSGYANALVAYLKTNPAPANGEPYAANQIDDIVGRQDITPYPTPSGGLRTTDLTLPPYSFGAYHAQHTWTGEIPDVYRTTLEVKWEDSTTVYIGRKFFVDQIYGRRLAFDFWKGTATTMSTSGMQQALTLDHTLVPGTQVFTADYDGQPDWPSDASLVMNVDHPYAGAAPGGAAGTYMDQTDSLGNAVGVAADLEADVVILAGFGEVSERLLSKFGNELQSDSMMNPPAPYCLLYSASYALMVGCSSTKSGGGAPPEPKFVSMNDSTFTRVAADWMVQYSRMAKLQASIGGGVVQNHHMLGTVFVNRFWFADPSDAFTVDTSVSINSKTGIASQRQGMAGAIASAADALEGSVFEQQIDTSDATSVSARFDWMMNNCNTSTTFGSYNCPNTATPRFYLLNSSADFSNLFPGGPSAFAPGNFRSVFNGKPEAALSYLQDSTLSGLGSGTYWTIVADASYLGPGNYCGSPLSKASTIGPCETAISSLRGGAFLAFGSAGSGTQLSFANVQVDTASSGPTVKGGGAAAAPTFTGDYDPAGSAQQLKDSFKDGSKKFGVDLKSGALTYGAPADITVGNGSFPYSLSAQRTFRTGTPASLGGAMWTNNNDQRLHLGSSGMAIMGDGPVLPSATSLVAFYVSQQLYAGQQLYPTQAPAALAMLTRLVTEPFVQHWWAAQILHNTVSVNSGVDLQQFVRLPITNPDCQYVVPATCAPANFSFNPPSGWLGSTGGANWILAQSGQPVGLLDYENQSWGVYDNSSLSFTLTSPQQDVRSYAYWGYSGNNLVNGLGAGVPHGWHLTNWGFPQGVTVTYTYNDTTPNADAPLNDALVSVSNSLGRSLTFNYAPVDTTTPCYLLSITDSANRSALYSCSYGVNTSSFTVVTPGGENYHYTYLTSSGLGSGGVPYPEIYEGDTATRFTACAQPQTNARPYCYPLLTGVYLPSDQSNPKEVFSYDALSRISAYQDGDSVLYPGLRGAYQFLINGDSRGERMDPLGYSYAVYYDRWGRGIQYLDELGHATQATYDGLDRVLSRTEPMGSLSGGGVTSFGYDPAGNTISLSKTPYVTTPATTAIPAVTAQYGACGKVVQVTDALGKNTIWSYDPTRCWLNSVTQPLVLDGKTGQTKSPVTNYSYTTYGLKSTVTDPTGLIVKYGYDNSWNATTRIVDYGNLNLTTTFYYDGGNATTAGSGPGNITSAIDPLGNATAYGYDLDRRVTSSLSPVNFNCTTNPTVYNQTQNIYSGELLTQVQQANKCNPQVAADWNTTTTTYSPSGKTLAVVGPPVGTAGYATLSHYDADDRATDSVICLTTGAFGTVNPLAPTCPGASRTTHTVYDAAGEAINVYKGWGKPGQITYATNHYNADGVQDWVRDANGNQSTNVLDGYDRLYQLQFPGGSYEQYAYDVNGNITSKRNRDTALIGTTYDALNRVTQRSVPAKAGNFQENFGTTYDLASRKWTQSLTDSETGTATTQTLQSAYDTAGRLTGISDSLLNTLGSGIGNVGYTYDSASNISTISVGTAGTNWAPTYHYDPLKRLSYFTTAGGTVLDTYSYDTLSHLTGEALQDGSSIAYGYQPNNDLLSLTHTWIGGSLTYTYTTNGGHQIVGDSVNDNSHEQQAASTPVAYSANALNQYSSVGGTNPSYDATGNLTGDGTFTYAYDEENRLRTASGSGHNIRYDYDPQGRRRAKIVDSATTYFIYDGQDELAQTDAAGNRQQLFVHAPDSDLQVAMYTDSGATWDYFHDDHHGSTLLTTRNNSPSNNFQYDPYGFSSSPTTGLPFRYTGQYLDAETGLYYYKARYYSPTLGRFLQTDPIGSSSDLDLYAYTRGDPLNGIDPTGNDTLTDTLPRLAPMAPMLPALIAAAPAVAVGVAVIGVLSSPGDTPNGNGSAPDAQSPTAPSNTPEAGGPVPLPGGLVGTVDSDSRQQGNRANNGPLAPEHGGTGDAAADHQVLTGGQVSPAPQGSTLPSGSQIGTNGVILRPETDKAGPRIDVPANGDKPHETLHYPKPTP